MSDAIEFGIGGNNKGFVAVLNDTEKKAKESTDKVNKELDKVGSGGIKGKRRITADLDGIAGEFAKVTSVSGGLEMALSKVGTGLKAAGAVGAAVALGKAIYDASMSATELNLAMERIGRSGNGGVANFGMSKLQGDLDTIKQAREDNKNSTKDWLSAYTTEAKNTLVRLGNETIGEWTGSKIDVMSPNDRETFLKQAEEKALARIAEKQREIFEIERERIKGNKEGADIMAIESAYAERIQEAIAARNTDLQKQLGLEKETVLAAAKRNQDAIRDRRLNERVGANMISGDSSRGVNLSAEAEQRQANLTRAGIAGMESETASNAAKAAPEDKDLAQQASLAASNLTKVLADNDRWERDIARSKKDQLAAVEAEMAATRMTMQGRSVEAQLLLKKVSSEQAATKALREGNTELAQRIRQSDRLNQEQLRFNRALDQTTNKLKPERQRSSESRAERRAIRKREKAEAKFIENAGLLRVQRDTGGQIIGGYDPELGRRINNISAEELEGRRANLQRKKNGETEPTAPPDSGGGFVVQAKDINPLIPRGIDDMLKRTLPNGGTNFKEALQPRGIDAMLERTLPGGGTDFAEALKPRGAAAMLDGTSMSPLSQTLATTEMDQKQTSATANAELRNDMSQAAKAQTSQSSSASDPMVARIAQILEGWK